MCFRTNEEITLSIRIGTRPMTMTTAAATIKPSAAAAATNDSMDKIYQYNSFFIIMIIIRCHWWCKWTSWHRFKRFSLLFFLLSIQRKARFWINCRQKFAIQIVIILLDVLSFVYITHGVSHSRREYIFFIFYLELGASGVCAMSIYEY